MRREGVEIKGDPPCKLHGVPLIVVSRAVSVSW